MKTYQEIMMLAEIIASKAGIYPYSNIPFNYVELVKLCDMGDRWLNSYFEKIQHWHEPNHLVDSTRYRLAFNT